MFPEYLIFLEFLSWWVCHFLQSFVYGMNLFIMCHYTFTVVKNIRKISLISDIGNLYFVLPNQFGYQVQVYWLLMISKNQL